MKGFNLRASTIRSARDPAVRRSSGVTIAGGAAAAVASETTQFFRRWRPDHGGWREPWNPRTRARTAINSSIAVAVPGGAVQRAPESQVRTRLPAGGKWIRTMGPPPEIVVDPSGSRRDHRAKYGCLSARPRVRCLCPPGKIQHLLPKSVFDRPGSDRWNLASTTFPDAGPMVRIRFPPAASLLRT